MGFARTLQVVGGAVLTGVLISASAPVASADQVRNDQWPLKGFDAEAIWKQSEGRGVTVAVIDAGVDAQHVDLSGNVIQGKNYIDGGAPTPDPDDSHGTQMASIIAGHGHGPGGTDGVMGLAPKAHILNIRDDGSNSDGLASSIRYAVDRGASVINISQGGGHSTELSAEQSAINYALQRNVLIVAATGNDGGSIAYPANYPGVLAVGGINNNLEAWKESNYGPNMLLTAPATNIVCAGGQTHTAYRSVSGTSPAAAFVSGAAALLRAKFPDLTAGQIANRLVKTAGLPPSAKGIPLPDEHYGYGFIQPLAALKDNIPAGSKYGPLTAPKSLSQSNGTATPAAADGTPSSSNSTLKRVIFLVTLGLMALAIVALAIFVIVKIARRNKGGGNGPGGPGGPGGHVPGQPPYGQQPYQQQPQDNQYMAPHQGQPQYPAHPQQQPPSSWGNQ